MLSVNAIKALAHTVEKNSDAPLSVYIYIYIKQAVCSQYKPWQTGSDNQEEQQCLFLCVNMHTHTYSTQCIYVYSTYDLQEGLPMISQHWDSAWGSQVLHQHIHFSRIEIEPALLREIRKGNPFFLSTLIRSER